MDQKKDKQYKIKKVGPYFLIKEIGSGTSAKVFQGKVEKTFEKVAIKQIAVKNLNEKSLQRVTQEFDILEKIDHKNIVKFIDQKKSDNHRYIIFEYCQYGDLDNYIKKYFPGGKMPEKEVQQVIKQLSSALKLMQSLKIVHRDLKLANILVGEGFVVKIADFGFAKLKKDDQLLKSTLGTPITMGPEILEGKAYNEKCDIWSIGVIIYQMIYGKPPFMPKPGTGIIGLKQRIAQGNIDFSEVNISEPLKQLISRLLVQNPNQRMSFPEFFEHEWVSGKFNLSDNKENQCDLSQSLKEAMTKFKGSQVITQQNLQLLEKQNTIKKQLKEEQKRLPYKPNLEVILALKIHFEIRKHLEHNIFKFLAWFNQIKHFFEPQKCVMLETKIQHQQSTKFQEILGIGSLLISQSLQNFLGFPIGLEYQNVQLYIQNFRNFLGQFLLNGTNDIANIALILQKKLNYLQQFSEKQTYTNKNLSPIYELLWQILFYLQEKQEKLENQPYKFFEEYKQYEDFFQIKIEEIPESLDNKAMQITNLYGALKNELNLLLQDEQIEEQLQIQKEKINKNPQQLNQ